VARPRLSERLNRGAESKLMLVSAPAGFGKTTLLTEWLGLFTCSVAWVSLDQADNHSTSFWSYVVAALQTVKPSVGASALSLLQSPQPPPIEAVLTVLLNELSAMSTDPVLVLDDYHVIDARDIHDGMLFLLDHLPPRLHLVIASRTDPPLPLARLRARGDLVEVRAADVRFTIDEAATYFREVMALDLSAQDVAVLDGRTKGWIAALQLAALSMQGRDDVAGFIAGFAGDDRYIVDCLVEGLAASALPDPRVLATDLGTGSFERTIVRCRHRSGRWQSNARDAAASEPVRGPARRSPTLVSLPSPLRRCAASTFSGRAARMHSGTEPTGECVVRAQRRGVGGDPPRAGCRRFSQSGGPHRASRARTPQHETRGRAATLACGAPR
jgi:hypothetical protein